MNRIASVLLAMTFSLNGILPAEAKTIRCDAIFQPTVSEVLNQLDLDSDSFLFKGQSFKEYNDSQSWLRRRKIRKLVQDIEVRSFASSKALERYTIELSTALFGSNDVLDRWIFKTKDGRLEESAMLLVREQLIRNGLQKTWSENFTPENISMLKKVFDKLQNLKDSRLGSLAGLPMTLPKIKNQEIPPDLMFKLIRDGFDAHVEEVRVTLNLQSKIEAYNTFRRLYTPVFFGTMMIYQMASAYQQMQQIAEQQVQKAVNDLREQRKQIETAVPKIKQDEFNQAYEASIAEFKQKWGEMPTPEEDAAIKAKIAKALKMN